MDDLKFTDNYLDRYGKLKQIRSAGYDTLCEEVAKYIKPHRQGFITQLSAGQRQTDYLFDSTAPDASQKLAYAIHGSLVSSSLEWFGLKFSSNDEAPVEHRQWLEKVVSRMHAIFSDSNWDAASEEAVEDMVDFGQGALWCEEKTKKRKGGFPGVRFEALHPASYWVEEDEEGYVNVIFRKVMMSRRAAWARWSEILGESFKNKMLTAPHEFIEILHVVEPRADAEMLSGFATKTKRPYASVWIAVEEKVVLEEGGYYEFPCAVFRWSKSSGEVTGRGPAFVALPDVRTLNKSKELGLKAWAKVLDPPLKKRANSVTGNVNSVPGGVTIVRNMDDVAPLYDSNAFRFDVSQMKHMDLKASIERTFFVDQIQLPPVGQSKTMSATEIEVRYEQMSKILGPAFGRVKDEGIAPIVRRVFYILFRAGEFVAPPETMTESTLHIRYVNPFERAQKQSKVVALERFLQGIASYAALDASILDLIDPDKVGKIYHDGLAAPEGILRTATDLKKLREAKAARTQQQAELQARMANAEAMSKAGKAVGNV